jgi:hypothetical protein
MNVKDNPNFMPMAIMAVVMMGALFIKSFVADPVLQTALIVVDFVAFFAIFFVLDIMARLAISSVSHLMNIVYMNGVPTMQHFFLPPAGERNKPITKVTNPEDGKDWYIYLTETMVPIELDDGSKNYGKFTKHLFILPAQWQDFFRFQPRRSAAFYMGQVVDSGASEVAVSYVSPFFLELPGERIPVYFFRHATVLYDSAEIIFARMAKVILGMTDIVSSKDAERIVEAIKNGK